MKIKQSESCEVVGPDGTSRQKDNAVELMGETTDETQGAFRRKRPACFLAGQDSGDTINGNKVRKRTGFEVV